MQISISANHHAAGKSTDSLSLSLSIQGKVFSSRGHLNLNIFSSLSLCYYILTLLLPNNPHQLSSW